MYHDPICFGQLQKGRCACHVATTRKLRNIRQPHAVNSATRRACQSIAELLSHSLGTIAGTTGGHPLNARAPRRLLSRCDRLQSITNEWQLCCT
jgi:hypothetical protein